MELTLGHLDRSESLRTQVTETMRRTLGDQHPDTLRSLHELASLNMRQGKYVDAERTAREVWEARRRILGADHPETLRDLALIGNILSNQGKNSEAATILH